MLLENIRREQRSGFVHDWRNIPIELKMAQVAGGFELNRLLAETESLLTLVKPNRKVPS